MSSPDDRIAIRTENLTKHYDGDAVRALRGVDVVMRQSESVAIMGPSGSGKSTFLNLIGTLDVPTTGAVYLNGRDVAELPRIHEVRRQTIGFVFQFHNLIPNLTLSENVQVPLAGTKLPSRERARRADELLERVGLLHRRHHRANRVSGGERQRAAVARAMINRPAILLADEPTGNLDSETGRHVLDVLTEMHRDHDTLLVVVTHNPEVAGFTDRVLRFQDGQITSDDTTG